MSLKLTTYFFERRFIWLNLSLIFFLVFTLFIPISKPIGTIGLVASLFFSLLSLSEQKGRKHFREQLGSQRVLLLVAAFYLIYVVGTFYSEDFPGAMRELLSKHYFLSLPLAAMFLFQGKMRIRLVKDAWILSNTFVAILIVLMSIGSWYWFKAEPGDLSPFVQRPRASIFLALAVVFGLYELFSKTPKTALKLTIYSIATALNLIGLILMGGRVGLSGLLICLLVILFSKSLRKLPVSILVLVLLGALSIRGMDMLVQPFNEALQEIENHRSAYINGSIEESSMGQRLLFLESNMELFEKYPVFGVGTGDLNEELEPIFKNSGFDIPPNKAHNQYLDIAVRFGFVGLFVFLLVLVRVISRSEKSVSSFSFLILLCWSMLFDDTLETQAGLSFTCVFMCLFLSAKGN